MFIFNSKVPPVLQPLLRDALEKNPNMTAQQAAEQLDRCLKVLYYRDARSLNKVGVSKSCTTATLDLSTR